MKVIIQVLSFVTMLTLGNILWKYGLIQMNGFMVSNTDIFTNLKKLLVSPWIRCGSILYIVATLWWFYIMSKENLSYIYPLASIGYVITMFAGYFLFEEVIPFSRWIGIAIVVVGFIVIAKS